MAKTHECKSWTHFFQAINDGRKTHDLRYDADRGFEVGDTLHLREYDPFEGRYTGAAVDAEITFVTSSRTPCAFSSAVLPKDYCILSLRVKKQLGGAMRPGFETWSGAVVRVEDWVRNVSDGRQGQVRGVMQDGEAEVRWTDGTASTVKWKFLEAVARPEDTGHGGPR